MLGDCGPGTRKALPPSLSGGWAAYCGEPAGGKDVGVGGGADVIRQALRAGYLEELSISIAPVILGGGKRLFDDFDQTVNLEHLGLLQSPFATHASPIASCAERWAPRVAAWPVPELVPVGPHPYG